MHEVGGLVGRRVAVAVVTAVSAGSMSTTSIAAPPVEPLEIVAVDVSGFPTVVLDVALPSRELPGQVTAESFSLTGADDLVVSPLDASGLTVALVIDDGPGVPIEAVAAHQGSAVELIRNLPMGVEVTISTSSGVVATPTRDRQHLLDIVGGLEAGPAGGPPTLGPAVVAAAVGLESTIDARRQLIVLTGAGVDLTADEATVVSDSLDGSRAAMRAVAVGDDIEPNLEGVALRSGGIAVAVPAGNGTLLRSVDVLTTSLADQYRLTATMSAADELGVRLTVEDRVYATAVRSLGPPPPPPVTITTTAVPTTVAPTTTATTATPMTTAAPVSEADARAAAPSTAVGRAGDRAPSATAGVEAAMGVAALALVGTVIVRRRRHRPGRHVAARPGGGRGRR